MEGFESTRLNVSLAKTRVIVSQSEDVTKMDCLRVKFLHMVFMA